MATSYKTPGVYVEEVSLFPPSVAQVETAVPAFIGYTEKASLNGKNLHLDPTRITSLAEFEEAFGKGPSTTVDGIELDNDNNVTSAALTSGFLLYDSLRLFYANGGARCYIISIGPYRDAVADADAADFESGLARLAKEDEPTLILFPDAVLLSDRKLYDLQQLALVQCADLKDRFTICDLYPTDGENDLDARVDEFRDKIGISHLKYGAAYAPYLRTNLDKKITYRDIKGKVTRNGTSVTLKGLASDPETVDVLENAIEDADRFADALGKSLAEIESEYLAEESDLKGSVTIAKYQNLLEVIFTYLNDVGETVGANTSGDFAEDDEHRYLLNDVRDSIFSGPLYAAARELNRLVVHASRVGTAGEVTTLSGAIDIGGFSADWGDFSDDGAIEDYYPTDPSSPPAGVTLAGARQANMLSGAKVAAAAFKTLLAGLSALQDAAASYESTYEAALVAVFPLFKTIIKRAENAITEMPPSAAVAGVYADIDSRRGVWKAPANVSLRSVVGVTDVISHDEQKDLNVDVVAGKSINAIRPFTGKGILVWGARTLAGNDNEWRYVPVRRFFNMVEESTKKASEAFVFEPNDANTWTKVKSMIENFLINLWRAGALAGPTPDAAFFVKVGLGQTMTAQDVLNGFMIVEIGLAAVRPAEFIILRFSHKMQEA